MLIKNICKNCGKEYEYEPKRGTYKFQYCCQECKHEYTKKDSLPQWRICEYCGKKYWWDGTKKNYDGNINIDTKRFCSFECGKAYKYEKIKESTLTNQGAIGWANERIREKCNQTKLERYGDKNYNNREQCKQTCLEKYGAEHISKTEEHKQKIEDKWKAKSKNELKIINTKRKQTIFEKYGVEYASQSEITKIKTKETNLERYGAESYTQTEECKQKIKQTCSKKYGVEHPSQNEIIKNKIKDKMSKKTKDDWDKTLEKRKKTNLEKYNTEFPQTLNEIKQKTRETNLKKYGNEVAIQSKQIQNKIKQQNLKKYGVEYSIGSEQIQEQIRKTNLEKYGYEYPFQSKELRKEMEKNRKKTNLKKYGTPNIIQVKEFKEKAERTCLEKYGVPYNCMTENCLNANINTISKINLKFQKKLIENNISNHLEFCIEKQNYDFICNNILVEINPTYTHNSSLESKFNNFNIKPKAFDYHYNKTLKALKYGYHCIHLWDWDDEDKIIEMLKEKEALYARKLCIKVPTLEETALFLAQYHLQGSCMGQDIRFGLYKEDELIELMTFGKPRYNKKYQYELLRLCTKAGYKVIGGAEKLFNYFIKEYNPESVISYCDNSKFKGDVYKKLGMTLKDYGKPSKHWFNPITCRHITDNLLRQRGYSQLHKDKEHKKGENNEQLMLENGYLEIYDCGQSTYIWNNNVDL